MPTLIAVLKDLWEFFLSFFSLPKNEEKLPSLPAPLPQVKIGKENLPQTGLGSKNTEQTTTTSNVLYGEKAYVSVAVARVFHRPVWSFDGSFLQLPYATEVQALVYQGRFVRVDSASASGWVLKDEITSNKSDVCPSFENGEIYSSNHPDTKKLRNLTSDQFFAEPFFLTMQPVEYVDYKFMSNNRRLPWTEERPRTAGWWQGILKGMVGIQIGIEPKTGAIVEYLKPNGLGWVGYVEAVHIDEAIEISGVGRLIEGEYRSEVFPKEQWLESHPIFIQVT
jgi:hypothetical protein